MLMYVRFEALHIVDGIAKVDKEKCTMCGACIDICPMGLIEAVPYDKKVRVACNSQDAGKVVRMLAQLDVLDVKFVKKNCPKGAVKVDGFLAKVDYENCVNCKICTTKCPTKAISFLEN